MVHPGADDIESRQVLAVADEDSGLEAWIAVDERVDGLAAGGIDRVPLDTADEGRAEAKRRARGWTLAARAADLPTGGAQLLVRGNERLSAEAAFRALAGPLDDLEDPVLAVGGSKAASGAADAGERINPEGTVPARAQAVGILSGIQAVLWALDGDPRAEGSTIVLDGWDPVTRFVAQGLSEEGAQVHVATDADGDAEEAGHVAIAPDAWRDHEADVLVPTRPRLVTADVADTLPARGVCPAAFGTASSRKTLEVLAERQIQAAPETLVAAGALVEAVLVWQEGQAPRVQDAIDRRLSEVYERTRRVLAEAADAGVPATEIVRERWG